MYNVLMLLVTIYKYSCRCYEELYNLFEFIQIVLFYFYYVLLLKLLC